MMPQTVQTITKEELLQKLDRREPVQVVNVLDPKYYRMGFLPGSKRIPLAELDQRLGELEKTKEVITYCAGYDCHASSEAAAKLAGHGFTVKAYEGGITEWKDAALPMEE
jgi:ArsR family transcriptional regulator